MAGGLSDYDLGCGRMLQRHDFNVSYRIKMSFDPSGNFEINVFSVLFLQSVFGDPSEPEANGEFLLEDGSELLLEDGTNLLLEGETP